MTGSDHTKDPNMIIWINGPFGGGKSSVAIELLHRLPGAHLFDPEEVGFMLRNLLPGREDDFQDLPPWRPLVAATAAELLAYTGGPLIAPMTLLRQEYAEEIFTDLEKRNIRVHHLLLHADRATLQRRIETDTQYSENTRTWRLGKLKAYTEAHDQWLHACAHVIDTTAISISQVADRVINSLPIRSTRAL